MADDGRTPINQGESIKKTFFFSLKSLRLELALMQVAAACPSTPKGRLKKGAMPAKKLEIKDATSSLDLQDHACLVLANPRRWHDFVVSFLVRGVQRQEKCVYVTALLSPDHMGRMLSDSHAKLKTALASGQLSVAHFSQAYTQHGVFEPEQTLQTFEKEVDRAVKAGYQGLRVTGEMHWASYRPPGYTRLAQYEALLNPIFEKKPCLAVCQYDRALFAPDILDEIAGLHHFVVEA